MFWSVVESSGGCISIFPPIFYEGKEWVLGQVHLNPKTTQIYPNTRIGLLLDVSHGSHFYTSWNGLTAHIFFYSLDWAHGHHEMGSHVSLASQIKLKLSNYFFIESRFITYSISLIVHETKQTSPPIKKIETNFPNKSPELHKMDIGRKISKFKAKGLSG